MPIVIELLQIITLQRTPQDLRYDQVAAVLSFLGLLTMSYFINSMMVEYTTPLGYAIVQSCCQAVVIYGLLKWRDKSMRYVQTVTALFGTTVILQMLTLVALQSSLFAAASILFSIWNFYLMIIILQAALDCSPLRSVIFTVAYHFITVMVLIIIYPNFPAEIAAMANASGSS